MNNSQKWNFHTRLFLADARQNLTEEETAGTPASESKYSRAELDALEQTLREHESWLAERVEAQRKVAMNEDPAVETKDLRERAKTLELHLQKLVQKKPPRKKTTTTSSASSTASSTATSGTTTAVPTESKKPGHEEL